MNFFKKNAEKHPSDSLQFFNYAITGDPDEVDSREPHSPELAAVLFHAHKLATANKRGAEKKIKQLIERYPDTPAFKNYLTVLYSIQGRSDEAFELNRRTVAEHPDYLFGKITLAQQCLEEKRLEEIPKILGTAFDLQDLYPHREVFHISEFQGLWHIACLYFLETGNVEAVETRLKMAKKLHKETDLFDEKLISKIESLLMLKQVEIGLKQFGEKREHVRTPVDSGYDPTLQTRDAPVFHHDEITELYCHGLRIDHSILAEIFALPRETLIQDLRTVIKDSIRRYEYFDEQADEWGEWDEEKLSFPLHALFIIAELKAVEALPDILDFLRQGEELTDFWLGDHITGTIDSLIYPLANGQIDILKSFMLEPNLYTYCKSAVSSAVKKMAFSIPELREEALEWYRTIFDHFLANIEDDDLIDTDVLAMMAIDCLDIRATELLPVIKPLWDQQLLSESIIGDWESFEKDMTNPDPRYRYKMVTFDNIYDHYQHILTTWDSYMSDEDKAERDRKAAERIKEMEPELFKKLYEDEDEDDTGWFFNKTQMPIRRAEKKVGRNDPCPCGSGKKYKKCCLKKS